MCHKYLCSVLFFLFFSIASQAQATKILHQTFSIDSVKTVQYSIKDSVEVVLWAGVNLLAETTIVIENASQNILENNILEGRYKLLGQKESDSFALTFEQAQRQELRVRGTTCSETVRLRLYVPDDFEKNPDGVWVRK